MYTIPFLPRPLPYIPNSKNWLSFGCHFKALQYLLCVHVIMEIEKKPEIEQMWVTRTRFPSVENVKNSQKKHFYILITTTGNPDSSVESLKLNFLPDKVSPVI